MISAILTTISRTPGSVLIVIAAILWALDGILRRSLFALPPLTIVFFESLIGTLILLPAFVKSMISAKHSLSNKTLGLALLVSLLSGLLGTLWFTTALVRVGFISFSVVFLLQKLQPLFAIASARILLKEPLPLNYIKWAALALFSAFFVTFPLGKINLGEDSAAISAALFAFGAAAAWGTSTTFSKMLLAETKVITATTLRFFFSTLLALGALFLIGSTPHLESISLDQYATLALIALSTGMVALYIYYAGLKKTQVKISTILELVFPILAIFIDSALYKTSLHPSQYIAAIVLLFSIYAVGRKAASK